MKKASLLPFAFLVLCLTGCLDSGSTTSENATTPDGRKIFTIGMSQCNLGEPWRVQMNADIKAEADKHDNITMIFQDAQNDTMKQRSHVEEFVSAKVDLILISPKEAAPLTEPVAKAFKAGIPVIVIDRAIMGENFTCFIGADNKLIGENAGKWIVEKLGGKGKVVELQGLMTSVPGQDRHSGFLKGIAGSDIEIIFEADMKWLEPDARKEMDSALARFDEIDLVYAHNDPGAHGAYLAAKAAGREKDIMFVGIDALPSEGVAYVEQGIMDATFEYPTCGKESIETALKILNGEEVPKKITLPSRTFTKENVNEVPKEIQAAPNVNRYTEVTVFVRSMETPIEMFHLEHRQYPTSLEDLLSPPSYVNQAKGNWPYIVPSTLGADPWGNSYQYVVPGTHNPDSYDLWSIGPDGMSGTEDDIGNWD